MARLHRLPAELIPTIKSFLDNTRLDWRTCKRKEAALIRQTEAEMLLNLPQVSDWTLAGRLLLAQANTETPDWHTVRITQRAPPPLMEDPARWYLLQYRWITYGPQENGGW